LRKVISGGQTGVDQAALRAARDCHLEIGGWCPPGRECEAGIIPAELPLKETPEERSPNAPNVPRSQRTEWNVRDSDGTLVILADGGNRSGCPTISDAGTRWTIECAKRYGRPLLVCEVADPAATEKIREWLVVNRAAVLNVAGPGESAAPGIGDRACALLKRVFA
jgi:hypothetical protein